MNETNDHDASDKKNDLLIAGIPAPSTQTTGNNNIPPQGSSMLPGKSRFKLFGVVAFALVIGVVGLYTLLASRADELIVEPEKTPKVQLLTDKLKADIRAYNSALPHGQKPEISEIKKIAQDRKAEMLQLAQTNPESFLVNAISKDEKAKMPKDISALVEEPSEVEGLYTGDTVVIKNHAYKLDYNKAVPLYVELNSATTFKGYILDDHFVIPATDDGYKTNSRSTSSEKPSAAVTFDTAPTSGGTVTGTTDPSTGTGTVIPGVPSYAWRDGCGPTAVGMVLGYWDSHGYPNLVSGDATTVTTAVNQMIASHSVSGEKEHYEDYALPKETGSTALADKSALPVGDEHISNSVADFMHTSWSADGNLYGWSYSNRIGPAFSTYFTQKYPNVTASSATYTAAGGTLTFNLLKQEIDAKRPMVFLVDSDGNGTTDHFVTAVGYRLTNGIGEYAAWDTWSTTTLRWQRLRGPSSTYPWGVWGGFTFTPAATPTTPAPVINSFTATPVSITAGQSASLSWSVSNTATISINQNIGAVAVSGTKTVTPTTTTTYTMTAANSGGTVTKSVTVTVAPAPSTPPPDTTPPAVSVSGITNGSSYSNGSYTVVGNASDASGISKMEVYLGNKLVTTCTATTQCSYSINMKKLARGTYTVKVVAYDKANPANSAYNTITFTRI